MDMQCKWEKNSSLLKVTEILRLFITVKFKKKNGLSWYKELGADKFFEKADGKRKKNG